MIQVTEINNFRQFFQLRDIWNDVLDRCEDSNPFLTWEWLSTWWKHFGNNKKLLLLLAMEKDQIFGIAPLMYSVHTMFGLRRGKIEFIGTGDSDYNDFILAGRDEQCLSLFFNYLDHITEKWDCVDLIDVPENSKTLLYLKKTAKTIKPLHKCPYAELPETPEKFLGSLKRKQRRELQRTSRRLEEDFLVEFADYSNSARLREEMINFFELHQKRWKSRGYNGAFGNQAARNFHLEIAQIFSQKGWLGLFLLKLSRVPAAALYGFKYRSKYYAYLSGFDPRYFPYSVGSLLFSYSIAECIKQNLHFFDFMRGAEEYKDRWNTTPRWNKQITLTKCNVIANIQHWVFNEYWHQGNRLRYFLKFILKK